MRPVAAPEIPQITATGGAFDCTLLPVQLMAMSNLPADAWRLARKGWTLSRLAGQLAHVRVSCEP